MFGDPVVRPIVRVARILAEAPVAPRADSRSQ